LGRKDGDPVYLMVEPKEIVHLLLNARNVSAIIRV
jgi:hypothetical protein